MSATRSGRDRAIRALPDNCRLGSAAQTDVRDPQNGAPMKRLTMSLDDDLADAFEALVGERGYENRSEAFRDLLRQDLGAARRSEYPDGPCIATLSYLYDHHQRQLALRLNEMQHEHHELTVASMHSHLSHDLCIETVILRGRTDEVRAFAQSVIVQPGVHHGQLQLIPLSVRHAHGHDHLEAAKAEKPKRRAIRKARP
jgi:CopG family nickel-responsive transcriptional regulator